MRLLALGYLRSGLRRVRTSTNIVMTRIGETQWTNRGELLITCVVVLDQHARCVLAKRVPRLLL